MWQEQDRLWGPGMVGMGTDQVFTLKTSRRRPWEWEWACSRVGRASLHVMEFASWSSDVLLIKGCASTTALETFTKHLLGAGLDTGESGGQMQTLALSELVLAGNMLNSIGVRGWKMGWE